MYLLGLLLAVSVSAIFGRRLTEVERVEQWHRIHKWPPEWHEEAPSYRALMEEREREIMSIPGADERWENWMQYVQSRYVPSFTPTGFKLATVPPEIFNPLLEAVQRGLERWDTLPTEQAVDAIYHDPDMRAKFIHIGDVARQVHMALLPMHEEWGGMKLMPTSAYGVRMYRNSSSLVMHNDKPNTHVISSIVHIAHKYDDDNHPWPIEIEDHFGNLHAVNLEPGQMLFYESAKCLHGRRAKFRGEYYGSIFLHYQPVDKKIWNVTVNDVINAVPPHWRDNILEDKGSRWAGQGITTDSRVAEGAPPRLVGRDNPRNYEHLDL